MPPEQRANKAMPLISAVNRIEIEAPVLDLQHLERQTLGDAALQREVLALFVRQSARTVAELRTLTDSGKRREAAHALKGSARGIGAFAVAERAAAIEAHPDDFADGIAALARAVAAADRAIARHLSD
jgi:HPt (histidine-containing phosphotransfer) domain-containing protein